MAGKTLKELTAEQRGYIAGLLDGEGWIGIARTTAPSTRTGFQYAPTISVTITDRRVLDWLVDTTGLGVVYTAKSPAKLHHKQSYSWSVWSQEAAQLAEAVRPLLVLKGEQADLVVAAAKLKRDAPREGRGHSLQTWETLASMYTQLKALNQKGVGT